MNSVVRTYTEKMANGTMNGPKAIAVVSGE
jgi:hypothetical protein